MVAMQSISPCISPVEILSSIHKGDGASIVFHGRDGKEGLGAIRAAELQATWPKMAARLQSDCYFSINSAGKAYQSTRPNVTGLFASRKRKDLKYLNCLYVDIDRHTEKQVDLDGLLDSALELAHVNGIPVPAWTVKSGRGVWLLWTFTNPLKATYQSLEHWQMAASELARCFRAMGVDRATSADATRIMRCPDSYNHKAAAGFRVSFSPLGNEVDFYEMAKRLGVVARPTPITQAEGERRAKNPVKVRAARERWKRTYTGLAKLVEMRGTFGIGSRSNIVFYIAQAMHRAGMDKDFIGEKCFDIGFNYCQPPLDTETIERKIASGKEQPKHGGYTGLGSIIRRFDISAQELQQIPELVKKKKQRPESKLKRNRAEIIKIISGLDPMPVGELLAMLKASGYKVSRTTLWRYMGARPSFTTIVFSQTLKHEISNEAMQ
jgi:hypothetical protein